MDFIFEHIAFFRHIAWLLIYFIIFSLLEYVIPIKKQSGFIRPNAFIDICYSFMTLFFDYLSVIFSIAVGVLIGWESGIIPNYTFFSPIYEASGFVQFIIVLVVLDISSYFIHRLNHTKLIWKFHAIHHSPIALNWLSTYRNHPFNVFLGGVLGGFLIGAFFRDTVVLVAFAFSSTYTLFIHSNCKVSYGVFDKIFTSPLVHHWHHSVDRKAYDANFAGMFSIIDVIFGTFYLPENKAFPRELGVKDSRLRESLVSQLSYPFKRKKS